MASYTAKIPESRFNPHRLGRHIQHDERSVRFAHPVAPKAALKSVSWPLAIPTLDQGALGSCVANAGTELLASTDATGPGLTHVTITAAVAAAQPYKAFSAGDYALDEDFAVRLYEIVTRTDDVGGSYPPTDTGSDGLGLAKGLVLLGLAKPAYTHAFTFQALQTALQTGPAPIGINWYQSMFNVGSDGHLQVSAKSGVAGGHEILISAMDLTADRYWFRNHWGNWGITDPAGSGTKGWAWMNSAELTALLKADGDVTVITPIKASVPTPDPGPTPGPTPGPGPRPRPTPVPVDADATYWVQAQEWAKAKGLA